MDFKDVVKMVEDSEKRVDEMLKAARLERHERQPMDYERYKFTLYFVAGITAMVLGFVVVFMFIYFAWR